MQTMSAMSAMEALVMFEKIDTDKSGSIDSNELWNHILSEGQDSDSCSELFSHLDINHDGARRCSTVLEE